MSSAAATSSAERSLLTIHCLTTYNEACLRGEVAIGKMLVVETNQLHGPTYVINFPTKKHWRAPSQLSYIDALLVRHHKRQPAHAKLEPSPPPGERCFVYSPLGLAGDRTIPRRRPATAGVCNARRGLGGPRDQQPPAQSVVRR